MDSDVTQGETVRLEIYVPESHLDAVLEALHEGGAGRVGAYDHTCAITAVQGRWRPLDGAQPYDGVVGEMSRADEPKIETRCPRHLVEAAVAAVREADPYEAPVIDAIALL
jgi:hypothetical protein